VQLDGEAYQEGGYWSHYVKNMAGTISTFLLVYLALCLTEPFPLTVGPMSSAPKATAVFLEYLYWLQSLSEVLPLLHGTSSTHTPPHSYTHTTHTSYKHARTHAHTHTRTHTSYTHTRACTHTSYTLILHTHTHTHTHTVRAQAQNSWQNPEPQFLAVSFTVVGRPSHSPLPMLDHCLVEMSRLMPWVKSTQGLRWELWSSGSSDLTQHPFFFPPGFSPEQFRRPTHLPVYSREPPAHQHQPQPRRPREQLHPGARVGPPGRRRRGSIKVSLAPHTSQSLTSQGLGWGRT